MTATERVAPTLAPLEEPVQLRQSLRAALLDGADWEQRFGPELGLGDALWAQWGPALEQAGMARAQLAEIVAGYRREFWFWLLGDRTWPQVSEGFTGRVLRRLPPD